MNAVAEWGPDIGKKAACEAFRLSRASFYRHSRKEDSPGAKTERPAPPLALSSEERATVSDVLHSERFQDKSPCQTYATLLDEGVYHCSISTMYRILRQEHGCVPERRHHVTRPNYAKPELLATGPNQVWSWDITKLRCITKWSYFHLYAIIDIFSRYTVGWMVAPAERTALAKRLIEETCLKQNIEKGELTIHADRGSSMRSKGVAQLLVDLGVLKTHSRPHVSNDNPYSEAQFKTLKYCPEFPDRFGSLEDARAFCRYFFNWYNTEHRHSGIGLITPEQMHFGLGQRIREERSKVLRAAFALNPLRFKGREPQPPELPEAAWINPPRPEKESVG